VIVRPALLKQLRLLFALLWVAMAVEAAGSMPSSFLEDDDDPSLSASSPTELLPLRQDVEAEIRLAAPANPPIPLEADGEGLRPVSSATPPFRLIPFSHAPPPQGVRGRPSLSRAPPLT
jgi:hypothetical protein